MCGKAKRLGTEPRFLHPQITPHLTCHEKDCCRQIGSSGIDVTFSVPTSEEEELRNGDVIAIPREKV